MPSRSLRWAVADSAAHTAPSSSREPLSEEMEGELSSVDSDVSISSTLAAFAYAVTR